MLKSKLNLKVTALSFCAYLLATTAFVSFNTSIAFSQDNSVNAETPADNTNINQRDRSSQELTADQAGQHLSDRDIMQKIRKSVVADKSLSTYAHNIKIIATKGTVTLKGPVRSDDEKQNIIQKATDIAGENNVVDQISIKPKSNQ